MKFRRYLVVIMASVLAMIVPSLVAADNHLERETREIARLLKCPVCQNLSVADSQSQLAGQMRELIHQQLETGQSREQVLAYFVDRYSEEVLLDPPKAGFSQVVWWGAVLIPLGGAVLVSLRLRSWLRGPAKPMELLPLLTPQEKAAYEARLEEEVQRAERAEAW